MLVLVEVVIRVRFLRRKCAPPPKSVHSRAVLGVHLTTSPGTLWCHLTVSGLTSPCTCTALMCFALVRATMAGCQCLKQERNKRGYVGGEMSLPASGA